MHHRLSCGKLDQPIESGPVVHDASCIMRRRVRSRSVALRKLNFAGGESGQFDRGTLLQAQRLFFLLLLSFSRSLSKPLNVFVRAHTVG